MNKGMKRFFSLFLTVIMLCVVCFPAKAKKTVTAPSSGKYYRIKYAKNNRYLDIPAEGYDNNGTQLQIWDYAKGNQNQIFQLVKVKDSNNWHIVAQNGKIIEVRNSSHEDCAQVAQWDYHNLKCGLWTIKKNNDGTVSFQNVESKKFLNVQGGGNAENGRKMIQYYNDKTVAMKFTLEQLGDKDVYSADYQRNIRGDEISWVRKDVLDPVLNVTKFQKEGYIPKMGQELLSSIAFLSPNTVGQLVHEHAYEYDESTWSQIKAAIKGELTADAITKLASRLGYNIPFVGAALSILQILWDSREEQDRWNRFNDAAKFHDGQVSGVIVYTFYTPNYTYRTSFLDASTICYIGDGQSVYYKSWTGSNFGDVKKLPKDVQDGTWSYQYK